MARGRRQAPTISLFAFQDIVTSVMGIMLIVTLLLALDLVSRETQRASAAADDLSQSDEAGLHQTIAQLEQRKSRLTAMIEQSSAEIRASGTMPPDDLQKTIDGAVLQTRLLREDLEQLTKHRDELIEIRREQASQAPHLESKKQDLDTQRNALAKEQVRLEAAKQDTRVRFSVQRGVTRAGWLVDLGTASITVVPLGSTGNPISFAEGNESRRRDAFIQWLRRTKKSDTYLFFVVRPETTETFDAIRPTIDLMGMTFGFDLVGSNQTVLEIPAGETTQ